MPLYRCVITKHLNASGESWSNVYNILESSADAAIADITAIFSMEQAVSYDTVTFDTVSAVNVASPSDRKRATINQPGSLSPTGLGGPLPLFLTIMPTFTDDVKRPERKYLRTGAQRNNIELGVWSAEYTDFVNENYTDPLFGTLPFVGPSGERPTSFSTPNTIVDRQLGWHRRTRPGFHRGWVPD